VSMERTSELCLWGLNLSAMIYKEFIFTDEEYSQLKNADPNMKQLIDCIGKFERQYTPDIFGSLISCIVSQQLSNKAAEAIFLKFTRAVPDLHAETIEALPHGLFREIGLSNNKIAYIKDLSDAVLSGRLVLTDFHAKTDEQIAQELMAIKGIGPWTVEMLLIFSLGRKDVLSFGDLGIRKGMSWLYSITGELTKEIFNSIADRYSPNKTLASLYLWEIGNRKLAAYKTIFDIAFNKS